MVDSTRNWKLLNHPNAEAVKALTFVKGPGKFELFNLADDPGETNNLAGEQSERADAMKARLQAIEEAGRSR